MFDTEKLVGALEKYKGEILLIAIKGSPDPDSISSSLALSALAETFGVKTKIYHEYPISLPCNNRMINELDINLIRIDSFQSISEEFKGYCVLDHNDTNIGIEELPCVIHIDHHKAAADCSAEYQEIKLEMGSTASILTHHLKNISFLKESEKKIATALAFGIRTDTDNLTIANKYDYEAMLYLQDFYNKAELQSISRSTLSKGSINSLIKALDSNTSNMEIKENWLFAGVGYLKATQRDTLAMIADIMISVDGVDNVIVYGIVENHETFLEGCARTFDFSYDLNSLLKHISENAGAKKNKGAFKIPLGDFAFVSDKDKLWDVTKDLVRSKFYSHIDFTQTSEV